MDKKFLRVIAENTPGNSEYEIVLRGTEGDVGRVKVSGTDYAFDLFQDIKKIVELGEDIQVPVEDNQNVISPQDKKALTLAKDLVSEPKGSGLNPFDNPENTLKKALGKMYKKIASKITTIAQSS